MFARVRFSVSFHQRRIGIGFSFLFFCVVLLIHNVCASPSDRWQLSDLVGASASAGQNYVRGFECGNDFFSDHEVIEALSIYHRHFDQNRHGPIANHAPPVHSSVQQYPYDPNDTLESEYVDLDKFLYPEEYDTPMKNNSPQEYQNPQQHFTPITYQGPLYSDSGSLNYLLWPIQKEETNPSSAKYSSKPYYIVINKQNSEVVDVISRIKNNDHTKCIRMDGSGSESSTEASDLNNGYQCASEFLSDSLIRKSLSLALANNEKFKAHPTPYFGRLYPANSGYMMWPMFSGDRLHGYNSVEVGPYFLVIDGQGKFVGTVVEGLSGNFLRCPRASKPLKIPLLNAPNQFSEPELEPGRKPAPKSGYYCGRKFFSDEYVNESAKMAKNSKGAQARRKFPAEFNGPPFNEPLLLWPLLLRGKLYYKGSLGMFRVVLTKNYEVKAVAFIKNKTMHLCREVRMEERNHEKSNYFCVDHLLLNRQLVLAAERACNSFDRKDKTYYPARYEGPDFAKTGPYYTFPAKWGSRHSGRPGRDRVVIGFNCELVGALTIIPERLAGDRGRRFVFCVKDQERSTQTFIEPVVPIVEHSGKGLSFKKDSLLHLESH